jgi:hypothetical protein
VFIPTFNELNGEPYALKDNKGNFLMKEVHVGVNTKRLGEKTAEVLGRTKPNSEDLLKHYLYPLLNLGIIDKTRSNIDSRSNIFFPVETGNLHALFNDDKDRRLVVTDSSYHPSKKYLEDSCRTLLEYCSKGGGVNVENERKYRLVDHEGNEIATITELVDRYLSSPEICFNNNLPPPGL